MELIGTYNVSPSAYSIAKHSVLLKFFKPLITGLNRRLPKKIIDSWKCLIKNKDWKQLTESLLTNHYDPAYISNYEKKNQKIIKNFTFNKVTKSELNLLANKILNL